MYQCYEKYFSCRDGVKLYTIVCLPGEGKYPVIFHKTPYDQTPVFDPEAEIKKRRLFLSHGYAVFFQHCRGAGKSEGDFVPNVQERNDGLDMLEVIRSMPFYNGEIYLDGTSYTATVHFSWLDTHPADVKAASFNVQTCYPYYSTFTNGAYKHALATSWNVGRQAVRHPLPDEDRYKFPNYLKIRPFTSLMTSLFGCDFPGFCDAFPHTHPDDPFWENSAGVVSSQMKKMEIPVLFRDGWYDIYLPGMLKMWDDLPASTREKSAMVIGPWGHSMRSDSMPFPMPNAELAEGNLSVYFFDHVRLGTPMHFAEKGKIKYYAIGSRTWRTSEFIPSPPPVEMCLTSSGGLSNPVGSEAGEKDLTYTYDPDDPPFFPGGPHGLSWLCKDMTEQSDLDRKDVLTFVSDPIKTETLFAGETVLKLRIASDAPDTSFFARLYVHTGGKKWTLCETITSILYEKGSYTPGEKIDLTLRLDPIAWMLHPGDHLSLDVASANYPTFHAHTNTARAWYEETEPRIAKNSVFCPSSRIYLPLTELKNDPISFADKKG